MKIKHEQVQPALRFIALSPSQVQEDLNGYT